MTSQDERPSGPGRLSARSLLVLGVLTLIACFSLHDLFETTDGRWLLIAQSIGVAAAAAAAVMAALFAVFRGAEWAGRRLRAAPPDAGSRRFNPPVLIASLAWTALIGAPLIAPAVAAGDRREIAVVVLSTGAVVVGFFAVLIAVALLISWFGRQRD